MYTLQGKTWPTHHTLSMLSSRMTLNHTYLTHSAYSNLSHSRQQIWTVSLPPRRRAPDPIHNMMADWSTGLYPASLPQQPIKQWGGGGSQASVGNRLLGLPSLYHWHAIGTFNTCSQGLTHRSLTDTGRGYNLEGANFPRHTPQLS
jgi:hypothetical protein